MGQILRVSEGLPCIAWDFTLRYVGVPPEIWFELLLLLNVQRSCEGLIMSVQAHTSDIRPTIYCSIQHKLAKVHPPAFLSSISLN